MSSLRPGYRRRRSGSHLIYYVILETDIVEVVRIIHERADVSRLLDE